jgi:hypothetical protein
VCPSSSSISLSGVRAPRVRVLATMGALLIANKMMLFRWCSVEGGLALYPVIDEKSSTRVVKRSRTVRRVVTRWSNALAPYVSCHEM